MSSLSEEYIKELVANLQTNWEKTQFVSKSLLLEANKYLAIFMSEMMMLFNVLNNMLLYRDLLFLSKKTIFFGQNCNLFEKTLSLFLKD